MYGFLVLVLCMISTAFGASIDNGVAGAPEIECSAESIIISFGTLNEFEGHVYVKGQYDNDLCKTDATLHTSATIDVKFDDCPVKRRRSSNPKGLFISVVVVITFHPMFITMVDKAYNVQCFYRETEKTVSADLEVSLGSEQYQEILLMLGGKKGDLEQLTGQLRNVTANDVLNMLTTQVITQNIPMPTCNYQVLQDGPNGEPVRFAVVGQQVYHKWSCGENDENSAKGVFCMTVHTCSVANGQGKEVQLLDEHGCAKDKFLLNNLEYSDDLIGGQTSMVFKFADQPSLFFKCQIKLTLKEGGTCARSSDNCIDLARGKRSVIEEGEDVDVFSETITIFDIDDPISAKLDAEEVIELNRRSYQSGKDSHNRMFNGRHSTFCLSPVTFGVLIAVLGTVLITCMAAVALLLWRHTVTHKVEPQIAKW